MKDLLFVCIRNRVRSPFAEFLFRKMLEVRGDGLEEQIRVSSAGFEPAEFRELMITKNISPPEPFYGVSMSEPTLSELRKRRIAPPEGWRSRELVPDDVKNSSLIIVALMQQKQQLQVLFTEAAGKVFTTREIAGREGLLTHEVFSLLPFDHSFWWFCEENPDYVGKILSEMEEVLIDGFHTILRHLGIEAGDCLTPSRQRSNKIP